MHDESVPIPSAKSKTVQAGVKAAVPKTLKLNQPIAGGDGLDLGVGQCPGVEVFDPADGQVTGHDLGDEFRFGLEGLSHVGVK